MSRYEQETIINYNEEDTEAIVYTHHKKLINKLNKLGVEGVSRGIAMTYKVPKSWVRVIPKREISEEKRKILSERARKNLLSKQ
jgi:hypothetical protein